MSTVYVLGAGASYGYTASPTGVRPPLATALFKSFFELDVSGDLGTKIGWIIDYVKDRYGVPPERFGSFDMDAEDLMTALEDDIERHVHRIREGPPYEDLSERINIGRDISAFDQTLFMFTSILNEMVNGPLYENYVTLATRIGPDDAVLTFNWDVLLDRTLYEVMSWSPDTGYGIRFESIFEEGWRLPERPWSRQPALLKLHGSTNWLTRYLTRNQMTGERAFLGYDRQTTAVTFGVETGDDILNPRLEGRARPRPHSGHQPFKPQDLRPLCFVSGGRPFDAFNGRFRPGYAPFTYFYSPLDPNDEVPTSPLIIAPVRHKTYEEYAVILEPLWTRAAQLLHEAHRVVVVSFSFPPADVRVRELFKPARFRRSIEVVNHYPDRPLATLVDLVGTSDDVRIVASSFSEFLDRR